MRKTFQTLAFCLLASTALPAAANLVVNGSFETGDFSGWTQVNDTSFTGVQLGSFGGTNPSDGQYQAYFGPTDPAGGGITQDIATLAGAQYNLTFDLALFDGTPNAFGLFWDGGFVTLDFDLPGFPYTMMNATLTASTTGATTLGFIFYDVPSFFLLDAINLDAAIPEPATWAMMIAGFGLAGAAARRRTTKVTYA